jgi:hypothetical protein
LRKRRCSTAASADGNAPEPRCRRSSARPAPARGGQLPAHLPGCARCARREPAPGGERYEPHWSTPGRDGQKRAIPCRAAPASHSGRPRRAVGSMVVGEGRADDRLTPDLCGGGAVAHEAHASSAVEAHRPDDARDRSGDLDLTPGRCAVVHDPAAGLRGTAAASSCAISPLGGILPRSLPTSLPG